MKVPVRLAIPYVPVRARRGSPGGACGGRIQVVVLFGWQVRSRKKNGDVRARPVRLFSVYLPLWRPRPPLFRAGQAFRAKQEGPSTANRKALRYEFSGDVSNAPIVKVKGSVTVWITGRDDALVRTRARVSSSPRPADRQLAARRELGGQALTRWYRRRFRRAGSRTALRVKLVPVARRVQVPWLEAAETNFTLSD
jgi:hypothetical protein